MHQVCSIGEATAPSLKEALFIFWDFQVNISFFTIWQLIMFFEVSEPVLALLLLKRMCFKKVLGLMKLESFAIRSTLQWEEHCSISQISYLTNAGKIISEPIKSEV